MIRASIAAAAVLFVSLWSAPAEACSCLRMPRFDPADGATGVPLNVQVKLIDTDGPWFGLRGPGGEIPVQQLGAPGITHTAYLRLVPNAPLQPNTRYEVVDLQNDTVAASFTTGTSRDETPPSFGGITSFDFESGISSLGTSCQTDRAAFVMAFDAPEDDQTPAEELYFHMYVANSEEALAADPTLVPLPPGTEQRLGTWDVCASNFSLSRGQTLYADVRAVDRAGNESPALPVQTLRAAGCGCSATSFGALWPVGFAVLPLLSWRHRKRRW